MSKSPRSGRDLFRVNAITAGCLVALVAATGAQAQQAQQLDTVVVTGIRKGIEDAISIKKNKDSIVESVSAEDIGKLPDSSIAESIARLPGLAAQRVNGRATEINIRGLSGDFANTLLNGREQVSTGNNRSVEFDQYPSELLATVNVYKTPDSGLVGQGLSGTIDLLTVRPLSFNKRSVALNVRKEKTGKGTPFTGDGDRMNFSYIDQFADRTIGVAVGVARLKQEGSKGRSETYDTTNKATIAGLNGGREFEFNQGFKYFVDNTDETRTGGMAVLEFKPSKELHSVVDVFYSKFDKEVVKRGLEIQVNDSWKGGPRAYQSATLSNAVFENNRLVSGIWGNVNPLSRHIWEPRQDELKSAGWNTKLKLSDKLTGVLDVSMSSATSSEQIIEMEAGAFDGANNRPLSENVTVRNYNEIASLQYDRNNPSLFRLTDPESWGQNGYDKIITTDDKLKALRLSAQYEMDGLFSLLDVGVNYNKRDKTKGAAERFLDLKGRYAAGQHNPNGDAQPNTGTALPSGAVGMSVPGGLTTLSFDPAAAYSTAYALIPSVNADILRKGWEVNEKVATLFAKANLETEIGGMPLRGNIGVQYVRTDQSSTAPAVGSNCGGCGINPNAPVTLRTRGKTYNDVLPSMNLVLDMGGDHYLRAGVGRQMARARMDQLRAESRSEVNDQLKWSGSGGNPDLDPFRADALDLAYEKYFGNKGYVSVAAFHKKLKSYIFDFKQLDFDFTGFPNNSGRVPLSNIGEFTRPYNGKGGTVTGIEVAASLPLNLVADFLNGFGIQASYSDTDSKIKPFGDTDTRPLPGLSKTVATLTAYYENHGFQFRVASRKRSEFIAEIEGFGADREYKYARGEIVTDLQLGYEFQSGFAKGLSLLLQANNIGNEPYREYDASNGRDTKFDQYGKSYLLGVTYKF